MTPRREYAALAVILLLALAGRIAAADSGLWFDEFASLAFARQPLTNLWSGWMVRETNPPLFYTLLKGWVAIAGTDDRALRLLPILIGTAGIACGWALARRLGGPLAGIGAAALIALSPPHFEYSLELRGYALTHGAALAAMLAAIAYAETRRTLALAAYVAAAIVALYAHTMMIVPVALIGAMMLWWLRPDRRDLLRWFAASLVIALAWAWWAAITIRQMSATNGTIGWIPHPTLASSWRAVEAGYLGTAGGAGVALLTIALLSAAAWLAWRERQTASALPALLALAAPLLLALLSLATPVLLPRTLFWASGPLLVAVAVVIVRLRSPLVAGWSFAALLVVEALLLAGWLPRREKEDWHGALAAIERRDPSAIVLVEGDAMALAAAHYRRGARVIILPARAGAANRWSDGMATGARVQNVTPHWPPKTTVFTLMRGDSDPAAWMRLRAVEARWPHATRGRQPYVSLWRVR